MRCVTAARCCCYQATCLTSLVCELQIDHVTFLRTALAAAGATVTPIPALNIGAVVAALAARHSACRKCGTCRNCSPMSC